MGYDDRYIKDKVVKQELTQARETLAIAPLPVPVRQAAIESRKKGMSNSLTNII